MTSQFVDLHCHSTASDGTSPPADLARLAKTNGLSGIALTDHDTIAGLEECKAECEKLEIDFLPSIEISAEYAPGTMHILGYGVDIHSPVLTEMNRRLIEGRDNRNPKIVAKLRELGVAITMEEVDAEAKGNVVGRPHIAAILHRKGYVSSIKQAFNEYLAPGGKAYFDKERLTSKEALGMIQESGGLPVLAHPVQLRCENDAQLETMVKNLIDQGLAGIEVLHSDHDVKLIEKYTVLADRYRLLKTGGSDFHGNNKKDIQLGWARGRRIPREMFDRLQEVLSDSLIKGKSRI